jgi:hypothetical protein
MQKLIHPTKSDPEDEDSIYLSNLAKNAYIYVV